MLHETYVNLCTIICELKSLTLVLEHLQGHLQIHYVCYTERFEILLTL